MFGIKSLHRELTENTAQLRQLRVAVGQLIGMDAVADLVQVGVDAAKLDTTPIEQIDMSPEDMEAHQTALKRRGRDRLMEIAKEEEAIGSWARRGTERED